ncbi:MAG: ATP-dependent RecD-like DNA helicase, partial [Desulfobacterales bacterium]|nr:ATP-dependent RecD-like DNA helicase [Desulfobacterales bacterium]
SGFTIARLKVWGRRDLVTVRGALMAPAPGEVLRMRGEWENHPKYGEQFKVTEYETTAPATVHGIRKYLGSGLVKGIGPVMAGRMVDKFGEDTLEVVENDIERLAEVEGIGKKRISMIARAWEEQKEIRDVMVFLQGHGVGSGYAVKIFKQYGNRSVQVVKENPYRLAVDIFGIGFLTADRIARKLGFARDSEARVQAGVLYVLQKLADEGHVYYPHEELLEKSREILEVEREIVVTALGALAAEKRIVIEDLNEGGDEFKENHKAVFLTRHHVCELGVSKRLKQLIRAPRSIREIDKEKAIAWVQGRLSIRLAGKQVEAVQGALCHKALVITGGPGTGKTTIINAVLKIYARLDVKIMLAAPTGRAAKRMAETTGREARTIHRMLEFSPAKGGFQKDSDHPLKCDLLVIDEASMIDGALMHHLMKAVPRAATLILVGDVNQLPSVGAGNVLNDIIASGAAPVVRLNEIFRQAKSSMIIVNAHLINKGVIPKLTPPARDADFYFIEKEDPEEALSLIIRLTRDRIPKKFGFKPVEDIQILTPMHRGVVGAGNLNDKLQAALNPGEDGIQRGGRFFRVNDKVMQIRNNYEKEVFNGDIGKISDIRPEDQQTTITFDGRPVVYEYSDLDEIVLAYAVSVHKSQGSEYPAVVIPILTQHYILLQRNLIYTAVTRGRRLVVMVGARKALAIGVKNNKTRKRFTRLRERLSE